jgi:hypothetical protein
LPRPFAVPMCDLFPVGPFGNPVLTETSVPGVFEFRAHRGVKPGLAKRMQVATARDPAWPGDQQMVKPVATFGPRPFPAWLPLLITVKDRKASRNPCVSRWRRSASSARSQLSHGRDAGVHSGHGQTSRSSHPRAPCAACSDRRTGCEAASEPAWRDVRRGLRARGPSPVRPSDSWGMDVDDFAVVLQMCREHALGPWHVRDWQRLER